MTEIRIRNTKKGQKKYLAVVRIVGRKTRSKTFNRKSDADRWIVEMEQAKLNDGAAFLYQYKKHTMAELIDQYISLILPQRKSQQKTYKTYLIWWKNKIGHYSVGDVSSSLIAKCRDELSIEPHPIRKDEHRSKITVNRYLACLSIVFTYAVNELEWLNKNPVHKVKKFPEGKGRNRFLSEDEIKRLLKTCYKYSDKNDIYLFVKLALATGARYGELQRLQKQDVFLDNEQPFVLFRNTKNGEDKAVALTPEMTNLLKEHLIKQTLITNYVFPDYESKGKKPKNFTKTWQNVRKEAQLVDFRFHDLRHTCASYLAIDGCSLLQIASILGHKTMSMVKRYAHLTTQSTAQALCNMTTKYMNY